VANGIEDMKSPKYICPRRMNDRRYRFAGSQYAPSVNDKVAGSNRFVDRAAVQKIGGNVGPGKWVSRRPQIQNGNLVASGDKRLYAVRADETSSTCY